ncbi:hypothetical protein NIES2119_17890 [[Phormidium ambiguum] IAM M-71]|uniref:Uncharacterized protein n=1 Tax=[Phormidium ambiguum] IAM M-71 TaxID=454136 RepID=A0A1U7IGH8_9CYAN|nr:hypothetical protein [Phormidium ambiguum]OKH36186.1 hypothetical protein NIES2119_17890 [Phormidium ambiguum IAM M-71]
MYRLSWVRAIARTTMSLCHNLPNMCGSLLGPMENFPLRLTSATSSSSFFNAQNSQPLYIAWVFWLKPKLFHPATEKLSFQLHKFFNIIPPGFKATALVSCSFHQTK